MSVPIVCSPRSFALMIDEMAETTSREMPWKNEKDPYKIWISEIILQQTRVAQGLKYYDRFLSQFSDIQSLANAHIDEVLKMWEGLGYYSRARNIHIAAKQIMDNHNGSFPNTYDNIINLKGIGPYTAAAISSFAFGLPYAVVDGNVIRIVTRVLGITDFIDRSHVKKEIQTFVSSAIRHSDAATFNQAIMDMGAKVCTPTSPKCNICELNSKCQAFQLDMISFIPAMPAKSKLRDRYFHYYFISDPTNILIQRRNGNDIWKNLYELPMIEMYDEKRPALKILKQVLNLPGLSRLPKPMTTIVQILSHQRIYATFYQVRQNQIDKINQGQYLVERKKVLTFAYPKCINQFFEAADIINLDS